MKVLRSFSLRWLLRGRSFRDSDSEGMVRSTFEVKSICRAGSVIGLVFSSVIVTVRFACKVFTSFCLFTRMPFASGKNTDHIFSTVSSVLFRFSLFDIHSERVFRRSEKLVSCLLMLSIS